MCAEGVTNDEITDEWLNSDESPLAWDDESNEWNAFLPTTVDKKAFPLVTIYFTHQE